ncbi:MAG: molybdate ABC transporter permease subunit, partial [Mycobacterium sp.]
MSLIGRPDGTLPRWVYLPAALGAAFAVLPVIALAAKVDWARFGPLVASPASRAALLLSLRTAAASTALCLVLGVPLALVLARHHGRVVRLVRPLVLLPLVLPPVVGVLAQLY